MWYASNPQHPPMYLKHSTNKLIETYAVLLLEMINQWLVTANIKQRKSPVLINLPSTMIRLEDVLTYLTPRSHASLAYLCMSQRVQIRGSRPKGNSGKSIKPCLPASGVKYPRGWHIRYVVSRRSASTNPFFMTFKASSETKGSKWQLTPTKKKHNIITYWRV